jgi:hypothetical protein
MLLYGRTIIKYVNNDNNPRNVVYIKYESENGQYST